MSKLNHPNTGKLWLLRGGSTQYTSGTRGLCFQFAKRAQGEKNTAPPGYRYHLWRKGQSAAMLHATIRCCYVSCSISTLPSPLLEKKQGEQERALVGRRPPWFICRESSSTHRSTVPVMPLADSNQLSVRRSICVQSTRPSAQQRQKLIQVYVCKHEDGMCCK
jgi:hypothetical protein